MSRDYSHYQSRDELLEQMGFFNYSGYLKSDLWKGIRSKILVDGTKCFSGCKDSIGSPIQASQVHHGNYELATLVGSRISGLYPICEFCHQRIEFTYGIDGDGKPSRKIKTTLPEANEKLLQILFRNIRWHSAVAVAIQAFISESMVLRRDFVPQSLIDEFFGMIEILSPDEGQDEEEFLQAAADHAKSRIAKKRPAQA